MAEDGILNSKLGDNNDTLTGSGSTGAVTGVAIKQNTGNETPVKTNEEMDCSEHDSGGNPSQSAVPTEVTSTVHDRLAVGAVATEDKEMEVDDDSSNDQNQDELQGHNAEPVVGGGATPIAMDSPELMEKERMLLKAKLSALETHNKELQSAKKTLQKCLDDTEKDKEEIKRQLDAVQKEMCRCKEENSGLQKTIEVISTENKNFQEEIIEKKKTLLDFGMKDIENQKKMQELKVELAEVYTRSKQVNKEKEKEIKQWKKDLTIAREELLKFRSNAEDYRDKLQTKIKCLQEKGEKAEQQHKQKVDQVSKETKTLENDKKTLDRRIQELNEKVTRSENELKKKRNEWRYEIKEEREKLAHLQYQYSQLQQHAQRCYDQALTLQDEKKGLEVEKQGLLLRLSKLAGANLTYNNPNIADLSDEKRPTKLAEEFSELYDNEWTDAFEEIDIEDEGEKTNFMLGILIRANQLCQDLSNEHVRRIKDSFAILSLPTPAKQAKQERLDEHGNSDNDKNTPSGELKQTDPEVSPESSKENEDLVKSYIVVSNEDTLENGAPKTEQEQQEKKLLANEQENKGTETEKLEPDLTAIHKENKEAEREKGDQTNEETPADASFASGNGDDGKGFVNRFESVEEGDADGGYKQEDDKDNELGKTLKAVDSTNAQGETNGDDKQEQEENKEQSVETDEAEGELKGNGKQGNEDNQKEKTAKTGDVATHIKEEANDDDKQKPEKQELERTGRTDGVSRVQGDSNDDNRQEGNDENKADKTVKIVDIKPEGVPNDKDEDKRDGNNTAAANEIDRGDEDEEKEGTDDKAPGNMNQNDTEENATAKVNNSIAHGTEDGDGKDDKNGKVSSVAEAASANTVRDESSSTEHTDGAKEKQKIEEPEYKWMQLESDFDLLQNEAKKTIFEAMKFFEVKLSPEVKTAGTDKIVQETGINKESQETVVTYIQKCIDICWSMCRHQPPVHIDLPDIGDDVPFDTNKYKPYTKSGKHVSYIVWPALYLHDGGPLLSKGVAQGK